MPRLLFFALPKSLSRPLMLSLLISCLLALLALTTYLNIQPVIPLFYSLAEPNQYLASLEWIFLFPIFSFFMTFAHFLIVKTMKDLEKVVLKMFIWVSLTLQIILSLAMIRIILLVT